MKSKSSVQIMVTSKIDGLLLRTALGEPFTTLDLGDIIEMTVAKDWHSQMPNYNNTRWLQGYNGSQFIQVAFDSTYTGYQYIEIDSVTVIDTVWQSIEKPYAREDFTGAFFENNTGIGMPVNDPKLMTQIYNIELNPQVTNPMRFDPDYASKGGFPDFPVSAQRLFAVYIISANKPPIMMSVTVDWENPYNAYAGFTDDFKLEGSGYGSQYGKQLHYELGAWWIDGHQALRLYVPTADKHGLRVAGWVRRAYEAIK